MWLITYDSDHFTFQACGETQAEARDTFDRLLRKHQRQTGATAEFYRWATQDAHVRELKAGCGWRDDYELVSPVKKGRARG